MSPLPVLQLAALPGEGLTLSTHLDAADDAPVTRNESIRLDGSKMKRTPQGGIRGPAAVTRVGVFRYRHHDGPMAGKIVREYRPAEEVFHPDSLATLDQAPITDYHPTDNGGFVAPENFTKLAKGTITNVKHDATHVLADAVIQDAAVAKAVLRGERIELSAGYVSRMDWTSGVYNGQQYDVVQRNIRYNHVALLPRGGGRQGPDVALRFDAAILPEAMIIHLDGKDFDLSVEAERTAYHAAMQAKVDAEKTKAVAAVATEKTRADKAEARADAADAELAPLKAAQAQAARTALETQARKVMGEKGTDAKFDGRTDRQVRETAVGVDCTGKSDDYVLARFDSLLENVKTPDPALEAARAAMQPVGGTLNTETTPVPAPWTQAWKQPLAATKDK